MDHDPKNSKDRGLGQPMPATDERVLGNLLWTAFLMSSHFYFHSTQIEDDTLIHLRIGKPTGFVNRVVNDFPSEKDLQLRAEQCLSTPVLLGLQDAWDAVENDAHQPDGGCVQLDVAKDVARVSQVDAR